MRVNLQKSMNMRVWVILLFSQVMLFSQEIRIPSLLLKNEGQLRSTKSGYSPKEVFYYMQTPSVDVYITEHGLTYAFKKFDRAGMYDSSKFDSVFNTTIYYHRVDVKLKGARLSLTNVEEEKDPIATVSFYNELVPEGLEHRAIYRRVVFKEIYPHIDMEFIAENDVLKYNLILHPGAKLDDIRFIVEGSKSVKVDSTELTIASEYGTLQEGPLYAYTSSGVQIPLYFKLADDGEISFESSDKRFNFKNETVIIDPPLVWSTYYGGNGDDDGKKIVSTNTAIYALIETASSDFPVQSASGAYNQSAFAGNKDWAVVKFTHGGQLLWATFYGGSGEDLPFSMSVGKVGLTQWLAVVGSTKSTDMPTRNPNIGNYFQSSLRGGQDAFIVLFGANDSRVWATYMGGTANIDEYWGNIDEYYDVYVDTVASTIWAIGHTTSNDFPTQSYSSYYFDNSYNGDYDVFIQRFSSNLSLLYSTYYGGNSTDNQPQFDVNSNQQKALVFHTTSTDLSLISVDATSYQQTYNGNVDYYLAFFNASMQQIFGTYVGGSQPDYVRDVVAVDTLWFTTGATYSGNYPTANPYGFSFIRSTSIGSSDVFLTAFNRKGRIIYSTFMGGYDFDDGAGLVYDKTRKYFYVFGYINGSGSIPIKNPGDCSLFEPNYGLWDGFIFQFDSTFTPLWTTHYGGTGFDRFRSGTLISDGTIYLTGRTGSINLLIKNPNPGVAYVDSSRGGINDAFIAAFKPCPKNFNTVTASASAVCVGNVINLTASGGTTYTWSTGSTGSSINVLMLHDTTIIVTATNAWGCCERDTVHLVAYPLPVLSVVGPDTVCEQTSHVFTASGASSYIWSNNTTGNTTTYTFTTSGTHQLNVIGITNQGCRDTLFFDVYACPLPMASINVDTTLCDIDSVQICGAGGVYYFWNVPAASPDSTTVCFTYAPSSGSTTVSLYVKDGFGCQSTPVQKVIKKTEHPQLFNGDTLYKCPENTVTLTYGVAGIVIWNTGQSSQSIVVSSPGLYSVEYIDSIGCTYHDSMYVENYIVAQVHIITHPASFCKDASPYDLEADRPGGIWQGSGIINSTTGIFDPSAVAPGSYSIIYLYTDSNNCQAKDTTWIQVYALPNVQIASHPEGLCNNATTYTFQANLTGGVWGGTGMIDTLAGIFDPATVLPGIYEISYVYVDSNLCQAKDTTQIKVYEVPEVDASTVKESCQGAENGQIIMTSSHGTPPYTYYLNAQVVDPTVYNLPPGSYAIYVVDNNNCASNIKTVNVLPGDYPCAIEDVFIPNIFSPNGDNENDVFTVYSKFIVSMNLIVYDRYGEKVFETRDPNVGWDGTYKGTPVEEGIYFYYFTGKLSNGKFIKRSGSVHLIR